MKKLVLIDGNSILNRAFYGIGGNRKLTSKDGTPTQAVYGFLAIMFKIIEDLKPEYLVVSFDVKGKTARHKMYSEYKANRKRMPDELSIQMPIIKKILRAMNIDIVEKEGYEGDDILGTLSVYGEKQNLDVTILSGDRDTFQLATDKVTIRIPRTRMGKTEVDNYSRKEIQENYGIEPKQLIEVKGLQGDNSDNIPGVPGIGEKTALKLVQEYGNIENLYKELEAGKADDVKGKARERLLENKDLAELSKTLGTINLNAPIDENLEEFKLEEWNKEEVYKIFKELNFNKYIERFNLKKYAGANSETPEEEQIQEKEDKKLEIEKIYLEELFDKIIENIEKNSQISENKRIAENKQISENKEIAENKQITANQKITENKYKLFYEFKLEKDEKPGDIIKEKITQIYTYFKDEDKVYYSDIDWKTKDSEILKNIFEDDKIEKYGYKLGKDYVILKQNGINPKNMVYDAEIAVYDLDPSNMKYDLEGVSVQYLDFDIDKYMEKLGLKKEKQVNLFDQEISKEEYDKNLYGIYVNTIYKLYNKTKEELSKDDEIKLFDNIEMPLMEVLAQMQYVGIKVDKEELEEFGKMLKQGIKEKTEEIHKLAGEDFNINSPKQLGEILFEKLKLPVVKKTKTGYSTDVTVLEKLSEEHPIISQILEYRSLNKLNSTYVEGLKPYINEKTGRIHSYFNQTITATGRISSSDPNLQNIPTRIEFGKRLRKVFRPKEGYVFIDADYSQIELRILAHIANDENMINAFKNDEDIHKQAASHVFHVPMNEVTKEQRSHAKAVNFGIVYGISDFGLAQQIHVSRKQAKEYIEEYLEKYSGVKEFMKNIVEEAKIKGYVETLFKRRRYIPELKDRSFNVRQFGARIAMNTPIQGTAADIIKIAMINIYQKIKEEKKDANIILQIHDELLIEVSEKDKEDVKKILQTEMENAIKLNVPLKAEVSEAKNWYDLK